MLTLKQYQQKAESQLLPIYGERETVAIVRRWFESRLGLTRVDLVLRGYERIEFPLFDQDMKRLVAQEPIQLILGEAYFLDLRLEVNAHTLIPRPETEELVTQILERFPQREFRAIDVGTGSGCIAIALASARPDWQVMGIDIHEESVEMARKNAYNNGVEVDFFCQDLFEEPLPEADLIVSNPPYIPSKEMVLMDKNVVDFEPDRALFVPDEDPLVFYRELVQCTARNAKKDKGTSATYVAFEIHEDFGPQMVALCESAGGKSVMLLQDLQGKDRMIFAQYGG